MASFVQSEAVEEEGRKWDATMEIKREEEGPLVGEKEEGEERGAREV